MCLDLGFNLVLLIVVVSFDFGLLVSVGGFVIYWCGFWLLVLGGYNAGFGALGWLGFVILVFVDCVWLVCLFDVVRLPNLICCVLRWLFCFALFWCFDCFVVLLC